MYIETGIDFPKPLKYIISVKITINHKGIQK